MSSYNPEFTSISAVEAMTGETIEADTDPNSSQVLDWIEQVETEMNAKGYATEALTDVIMDIPEGTIQNTQYLQQAVILGDSAYRYSGGYTLALPNTPFISVANVQRNLQSYSAAEDWESLTEGPGDDTDFLIVRKQYKAGLRGTALYFYRNAPAIGHQRLKLDYVWGYDLPATVLSEYACARASLMLLYAKYLRKEPVFNLDIAGLRTQLNPFTDVHKYIIDRFLRIEKDWLPNQYTAAKLLP